MSFRMREIIKDPDKRAILSWLGGGAVVVAVVTFVVEWKKDLAWIDRVIAELAARQDLSQTSSRNWSFHPEEVPKAPSRRSINSR